MILYSSSLLDSFSHLERNPHPPNNFRLMQMLHFFLDRTSEMGFTLYSLIEAALLVVNAVAILNEQRFLSRRESNE